MVFGGCQKKAGIIMGMYLNPKNNKFEKALNSQIYVDKTSLIAKTNALINTDQNNLCISRPRRFGKSLAMSMLATYYDCEADSRELFLPYEIAKDESFDTHLGKYNVIELNIQNLLSEAKEMHIETIDYLIENVKNELIDKYDIPDNTISKMMSAIYEKYEKSFIILIDEWDCIFREIPEDMAAQERYLDFLRLWLKDRNYVALAYMTGILPIKKYGGHSALNMFDEYSMLGQGQLTEYTGFTEEEVASLCEEYGMDSSEMDSWYNGYKLERRGKNISIYNPKSVVTALIREKLDDYWRKTSTFEALKMYIDLDQGGLRNAVIALLAGEKIHVDTSTYTNDIVTFDGCDDVLTLLVHLGYLGYDSIEKEVFIPNKEIFGEYVAAMRGSYDEVIKVVKASRNLLISTWQMDEDAVSKGIDAAHQETSILAYNTESALSSTISLAYYEAREYYNITREHPAGKGFADLIFTPRPLHIDKPAMVIELKWDKGADTAIEQIRERRYPDALKDFKDNLLLVGISYDKNTKTHEALIEKI
jgi:hypothetical protein